MLNIQTKTNNSITTSNLKDIMSDYVQYIDASPNTIETYIKALRNFKNWTEENSIHQPTRQDIITYKKMLEETHKATTTQTYLIALKQFFRWTEQAELYPNVADNIKGVKISKSPKKDYLNTTAVKNILSSIDQTTLKGKRDYAIIALMLTCGLRDIEVVRANVNDLRLLGDNTVLYLQGKGRTEKAEYVIIPVETEKALRTYLKTRTDNNEALFYSVSNHSSNERMTTRSISRIVKEAMKNAGYDSDRLTAHSLRHTAVTLALKSGATLQEVQQFARHTNINTTLIYAHNLERESNKCSHAIADSIFSD